MEIPYNSDLIFLGVEIMAKTQTFADKAKGKHKTSIVTVKVVHTVKSDKGSYKFNERFVRLEDINQVSNIK